MSPNSKGWHTLPLTCYETSFNISLPFSDQTFVLRHIANVLHRYENDKNVSNWTMEIQSRVQAALLEKSTNAEFLMDLFMLCIVVCSGYATLFGSTDLIASCRQSRLDGFPAALHILSERAFWRDCTVRVSEWRRFLPDNRMIFPIFCLSLSDLRVFVSRLHKHKS